MRRKDFLTLVQEAAEHNDCQNEDLIPFEGLALHKDRVIASKKAAMSFIRYQALQLNGRWDAEELASLAYCFKRVDVV